MIHVIAIITAQPGQRAAVLEAFRANVPAVLAEDGCIEYAAAVDLDDGPAFQARCGDDSFMVIEKWTDLAALKAHGVSPHMKAYAAQTRAMVAQRTIHVLQPT
ncbi:MAG: putative quinol monooxygenase [Burkholderiaceae bacterium]